MTNIVVICLLRKKSANYNYDFIKFGILGIKSPKRDNNVSTKATPSGRQIGNFEPFYEAVLENTPEVTEFIKNHQELGEKLFRRSSNINPDDFQIILNEFPKEVVRKVIDNAGGIDKYIQDCTAANQAALGAVFLGVSTSPNPNPTTTISNPPVVSAITTTSSPEMLKVSPEDAAASILTVLPDAAKMATKTSNTIEFLSTITASNADSARQALVDIAVGTPDAISKLTPDEIVQICKELAQGVDFSQEAEVNKVFQDYSVEVLPNVGTLNPSQKKQFSFACSVLDKRNRAKSGTFLASFLILGLTTDFADNTDENTTYIFKYKSADTGDILTASLGIRLFKSVAASLGAGYTMRSIGRSYTDLCRKLILKQNIETPLMSKLGLTGDSRQWGSSIFAKDPACPEDIKKKLNQNLLERGSQTKEGSRK